jgi:hypothetical protein
MKRKTCSKLGSCGVKEGEELGYAFFVRPFLNFQAMADNAIIPTSGGSATLSSAEHRVVSSQYGFASRRRPNALAAAAIIGPRCWAFALPLEPLSANLLASPVRAGDLISVAWQELVRKARHDQAPVVQSWTLSKFGMSGAVAL